MKRALVLGGGGPVGIAWESGLAQGLAQGGVDLRIADLIVGTSAGSVVGARIAHGQLGRGESGEPRGRMAPPLRAQGPDLASLGKIFALWGSPEPMTTERAARIGALACASQTVDEDAWVSTIAAGVSFSAWPATPLRLIAYDTGSGERVVFSGADAPIQRALAASCAVPGIFPPTTIGGRRYMDGGIASGTNADIAAQIAPDAVLVIAVITAKSSGGLGAILERALHQEVDALRAAGAQVSVITPDDADMNAFGPNLMDGSRSALVYESGLKRGLEIAPSLLASWSTGA